MTSLEDRLAAEAAPSDTGTAEGDGEWTAVCAADRVRPDRGIAALVDGEPVAVFRLSAVDGAPEEWCAVSHIDPFTGAPVIARGLVGSVDDVPTVASPLHKQRFDLRTGQCLDDATASLSVFPVRLHDDFVEVGAHVIRSTSS